MCKHSIVVIVIAITQPKEGNGEGTGMGGDSFHLRPLSLLSIVLWTAVNFKFLVNI